MNSKTAMFFFCIITFIGVGVWNFYNKVNPQDYKSPEPSPNISLGMEMSSTKEDVEELKKDVTEPDTLYQKELYDNLTNGEWKFDQKYSSKSRIVSYRGDILFKKDGSYEKHVTLKVYDESVRYGRQVKEESKFLESISGGVVRGKWGLIGNEFKWYEQIDESIGNSSYGDNQFAKSFPLHEIHHYGAFSSDWGKSELTIFEDNQIKITKNRYSGSQTVYNFFR